MNASAQHEPAVPVVTHDPYFSLWSTTDKLTDGPTRHWTGTEQPMRGLLRVDGKPYRLMGDSPREVPAINQTALEVTPARYGLPLDSRKTYTKLDWEIWTATLSDSRQQFESFTTLVPTWLDDTPSRVPLTDWYDTLTGKQEGFRPAQLWEGYI